MRRLAGYVAIAVAPSAWMVVYGFSLAMLLGFGKRRLESAGVLWLVLVLVVMYGKGLL